MLIFFLCVLRFKLIFNTMLFIINYVIIIISLSLSSSLTLPKPFFSLFLFPLSHFSLTFGFSLCLARTVSLPPSHCVSVSLSLHLCLPLTVSLRPSHCVCVCLSVSLSMSLCLSLTVSLSLYHSLSGSLCLALSVSFSQSLSHSLFFSLACLSFPSSPKSYPEHSPLRVPYTSLLLTGNING